MIRIVVISLISLCSVVPFLVLFNRILSFENDLSGCISIFFGWVVTPIFLLTIWKSKLEPSEECLDEWELEKENYEPMEYYPFSKAVLPVNELVLWTGDNPTFHRGGEWGIIITDEAIYYFSPFRSIFTKWKRYPISKIKKVEFTDSNRFPMLALSMRNETIKLRTPYDSNKDEMEFDRKKLKEGLGVLKGIMKNA